MKTIEDQLLGELLPAKIAATYLGVLPTKINQYARDNDLLILRREGRSFVPAALLVEGPALPFLQEDPDDPDALPPATHRLRDNLRGTITLLRDAGFSTEEIATWLWTRNEELGDTPIVMLAEGAHHHVNRVASTLGW